MEEVKWRRGGEGDKEEIQLCCVHAPAPRKECGHQVLQMYTNKK